MRSTPSLRVPKIETALRQHWVIPGLAIRSLKSSTEQLTKMFKAECQKAVCHDTVIVEDIREVGLCEHHLPPILMSVTIANVPDQKILGLSTVSRIAGYFARRRQNQERSTPRRPEARPFSR